LEVPPELQLDQWQPGNFDLLSASAAAAGTQELKLESGIRGPGAFQRPRAVLRLQNQDVKARQVTWWQIRADGASLASQIQYDVERGRVFSLPVSLPRGWVVAGLDLTPDRLLRSWTVDAAKDSQATLLLELQPPLDGPDSARLTLELRPDPSDRYVLADRLAAEPATVYPFPMVSPAGVSVWEG